MIKAAILSALLSISSVFGLKNNVQTQLLSTPLPTITVAQKEEYVFNAINKNRKALSLPDLVEDPGLCELAKNKLLYDFSDDSVKNYQSTCPNCSDVSFNKAQDVDYSRVFFEWDINLPTKLNMTGKFKYLCVVASDNKIVSAFANKKTTKIMQPKNSPSSVNSNASNVDCIGPDGKQFNTTLSECTNLNEKWGKRVDYIVNCNIHPDCGGGTVRMSYSQCQKPCGGQIPKNTNGNTNTIPNNYQYPKTTTYPPCTVYYPALYRTETYYYTTAEDCQKLKNNLNALPTPYIVTQPYVAPTQTQKTAEQIANCKSEVKAKYDDLIRGCYVMYQGSASNMCASGYQSMSLSEIRSCE